MKYQYEDPFRPNYEFYAICTWMLSIPAGWFFMVWLKLPVYPFAVMCVLAVGMATSHAFKSKELYSRKKDLKGRKLNSFTAKQLLKLMKKNEDVIWYGKGFYWNQRHVQTAKEILNRDTSKLIKVQKGVMGNRWIHGLEKASNEIDIFQDLVQSTLHTLIIGATGAGKTRAFETFITQCIARGETCIVLDPKGDLGLMKSTKRACELMGREDDFLYFHPSFPSESIRINPLASYNHPSEVASRISNIIDPGNNPTFRDFGFMAINNVVNGLAYGNQTITLSKIRRYLGGNVDALLIRGLSSYCAGVSKNFDEAVKTYIRGTDHDLSRRAKGLVKFYREVIEPKHANNDIDGLISLYEHDKGHFSKMITSTMPILTQLTSGDMSYMLSPDCKVPEGYKKSKKVYSSTEIINGGKVLFLGLDTLSNRQVGQGLGSMMLADFASVAGNRYNFGADNKPVNIFVDEAAECLNEQLVQLLNKGRGAKISMYLATQTISDITAKLGDEAKKTMVLGNINNLLVLRSIETETQTFVTDTIPKTKIKQIERSHGNNTDSNAIMGHSGSTSETLKDEEVDQFDPALLGTLPNLEYIAKLAGGRVVKGRLPILCDEKTDDELEAEKRLRYASIDSLMDESFIDSDGEFEYETLPVEKHRDDVNKEVAQGSENQDQDTQLNDVASGNVERPSNLESTS